MLYTRTEIQQRLGGELQTYAPQRNNRILALCVNTIRNPNAPFAIYVGTGVRNVAKADLLARNQVNTQIPVYLKEGREKRYQNLGEMEIIAVITDSNMLMEASVIAGREITRIIQLKVVESI